MELEDFVNIKYFFVDYEFLLTLIFNEWWSNVKFVVFCENTSIDLLKLSAKITYLEIGYDFIQSVDHFFPQPVNLLPSSIIYLIFGDCFE